jgi:hypothetical protein
MRLPTRTNWGHRPVSVSLRESVSARWSAAFWGSSNASLLNCIKLHENGSAPWVATCRGRSASGRSRTSRCGGFGAKAFPPAVRPLYKLCRRNQDSRAQISRRGEGARGQGSLSTSGKSRSGGKLVWIRLSNQQDPRAPFRGGSVRRCLCLSILARLPNPGVWRSISSIEVILDQAGPHY